MSTEPKMAAGSVWRGIQRRRTRLRDEDRSEGRRKKREELQKKKMIRGSK